MQSFRRLHVWERAHHFALEVRKVAQSFPRTGYGELKAQLISAAESIATNIVEGAAASSRKEFARYLDIAIKSASEVEYQLQLAADYTILLPEKWKALSDEVVQIRRMLCGLRRTVLRADRDATGLGTENGILTTGNSELVQGRPTSDLPGAIRHVEPQAQSLAPASRAVWPASESLVSRRQPRRAKSENGPP